MKKLFLILSVFVLALFVTSCESVSVAGITITSENNIREIKVNETVQLTAEVFPAGANSSVEWTSSNEEVATVDEEGLVTGVSVGNVEIIATSVENATISQKFALIVEEAEEVEVDPETITLTADVTTCKAGETITLTAVVNPEGANQSVEWKSSDQSVATVSRGEVSTLKAGTVVITVSSKTNPEVKSEITLTVEEGDGPIINEAWLNLPYTTHQEYMEAEGDTKIKVKGVVTHVCPVAEGKVTYTIQNGTDGFYVYAQDAVMYPVELGQVYEVGGYKKYYNGLNEIVNVEHFIALDEEITYTVNNLEGLQTNDLTTMEPYHCSVVTGTAYFDNGTPGAKAYSFYANVNGYNTTFRVDPKNMSAEEYEKVNNLIATAVANGEFEFTGIMSAFGYGKPSPQIMIKSSEDLKFATLSTEEKLVAAAGAIEIASSVPFAENEIELPAEIAGYDGLTITWSTESELIDCATGVVTHGAADTVVTLTATLALDGKEYQTTFTVTVFAADNTVYETVVSFDCEDALPAGSYGNSDSKSSYAEGDVTLGTPKYTWMLRNALITQTNNDRFNGTFGIRAQSNKEAASTARIELKEDVDFSVVEFSAVTYNKDATGAQIRIEYSTDSGETWVASETIITIDSYEMQTYRVKLPEGVKRVAIVIVENTGRRVNFDDIKLLK